MENEALDYAHHYAAWHITYLECLSTGEYPILPTHQELSKVVGHNTKFEEIEPAVDRYLSSRYPGLPWGYGLKTVDFRANAQASRLAVILENIKEVEKLLDFQLKVLGKTLNSPILVDGSSLPHNHSSLVSGVFRHARWPIVEGRMAGDGQLQILRRELNWEGIAALRNKWAAKIEESLHVKVSIRVPTEKLIILDSDQELVFLTCYSSASALSKLMELLANHYSRGILRLNKSIYSSSINTFSAFQQERKQLSLALAWFRYKLDNSVDDLSYSGITMLASVGNKILKVIEESSYLEEKVFEELSMSPGCLQDIIDWYNSNHQDMPELKASMGYDKLRLKLNQMGWKL